MLSFPLFFRDKIKLKPGVSKKQGDVALLLAHNQGSVFDGVIMVKICLWVETYY